MVAGVCHDDAVLLVYSNTLGPEKLPVPSALGAKEASWLAVRPDDQEPMVVEVGHHEVVFVVKSYSSGRVKVFPQGPFESILVEERPVGGEELHPVVPGVRDQDLTLRVDSHIPRIVELPILGTLFPKLQQELALKSKHLSDKANVCKPNVFMWGA